MHTARSASPPKYVRDMLVIGTTDEVAAHLADAAHRDARRVVVTFAGGDWHRQAELLADARALLGLTTPGTSDRV